MKAFKSLVFLVVVVLVLSVDAKKSKGKKKPPIPATNEEEAFSNDPHFNEGKHSEKYDHDAFLGEDEAREYDHLTPKETKQRLRGLFPKIDVDQDKKVSLQELVDWIDVNMKKHVRKNTDSRMMEMDANKDGKISWDEYIGVEYNPENEKELSKSNKEELHKMKERDQTRWKHADMDNDNILTRDELAMMIHPEETPRMTNVLIQENLELLDKDGDGKVSFAEYAGAGADEGKDVEHDTDTLQSLKDTFNKDLDKDKDGALNKDELKAWILPGDGTNPSQNEAEHLMKEADENKDNYLSIGEIIKNHELFAGSRATNYGEMLKGRSDL